MTRQDQRYFMVDGLTKGLPPGIAPFDLAAIGAKGWNVLKEDLPLPLAVIREAALAHNSHWMRDFLARSGAIFSPHGKTTMSPQLFRRQIDDGAWAITVATAQQIAVCRAFGFKRVVLANQLVGRQAIAYVLESLREDPDFDLYCLIDSLEGVALLDAATRAAAPGRPLKLLLEGGVAGGRTGCRDREPALAVARAVAASPGLVLCGVEGFEGLIKGEGAAEKEAKVEAFLDFLVELAALCDREDLFAEEPVILSAGGSSYYDLVVARLAKAGLKRQARVLTRSGCYLTHDSARYRQDFARIKERSPAVAELGEGLRPALQVWAYVQSCPEPERVILTMGRRDTGTDAGNPVPELWHRPGRSGGPIPVSDGCRAVELNDQHTHMVVPAGHPFQVGDLVAFGISHPCTTFDKWQVIPLVDEAYNVTGAIRTFF